MSTNETRQGGYNPCLDRLQAGRYPCRLVSSHTVASHVAEQQRRTADERRLQSLQEELRGFQLQGREPAWVQGAA